MADTAMDVHEQGESSDFGTLGSRIEPLFAHEADEEKSDA
jgi:hypothetical protein